MFVCYECCVLSNRGLCDGLITRPEESYRPWCVVMCDLETSSMRRSWPALHRSTKRKKYHHHHIVKAVEAMSLRVTQGWINTALKTHQLEHEHVRRSFCSNVYVNVDWIVRRGVRRNYRQNQPSSFLLCNCLHARLTLPSLPWMLLIQIQSRRNEAIMSVPYEDQQAKFDLLVLYSKMAEMNGSKSKEKIQDWRKLLLCAWLFSFVFRKYGVQISKHWPRHLFMLLSLPSGYCWDTVWSLLWRWKRHFRPMHMYLCTIVHGIMWGSSYCLPWERNRIYGLSMTPVPLCLWDVRSKGDRMQLWRWSYWSCRAEAEIDASWKQETYSKLFFGTLMEGVLFEHFIKGKGKKK